MVVRVHLLPRGWGAPRYHWKTKKLKSYVQIEKKGKIGKAMYRLKKVKKLKKLEKKAMYNWKSKN